MNFSKPLETNHEIKVFDILSDSTPTPLCLCILLLQALYLLAALLEAAIVSLPRKASTSVLYGTTFLTDPRSWRWIKSSPQTATRLLFCCCSTLSLAPPLLTHFCTLVKAGSTLLRSRVAVGLTPLRNPGSLHFCNTM